jgi:DNA-binding MarR family transcriptional regulator
VSDIETLRRFNRCYTQRIGVLEESYLDSGRPLGPSRLLFEIGHAGARVGELRRRLGLDSGYTSRLLRQLEAEGLVTVQPDPDDRRQRVARLSPAGRLEWQRLDQRSHDVAATIVGGLSARQRETLTVALTTAERLLRAATVDVDVVDPASDDAAWALQQYFAELDVRFPRGFAVEAGVGDDLDALRAPGGAFLVARSDATVVGCGGVQRVDARTDEIKRMWIHPDWRGLGLGGRLLARLEGVAVERGRERVVLDTNASLTEAIAMYERAGYQAIDRYNDNPYAERWFAKPL